MGHKKHHEPTEELRDPASGTGDLDRMKRKAYEKELRLLQVELASLQQWVEKSGGPYLHRLRGP